MPLTAQQLNAARVLARGESGAAAARAVGVRPETVSRWRQSPTFTAELRRLVELAEQGSARQRAAALLPAALDVVQDALLEPGWSPSFRIAAATALLNFAAAALSERPGVEDLPTPQG